MTVSQGASVEYCTIFVSSHTFSVSLRGRISPRPRFHCPSRVPEPTGTARPPTNVEETKLSNGVRVVSLDNHGPIASVGVYVRSGSRADRVPGTAHALQHMAFKQTQQRTAYKLYRDIENFGGIPHSSVSREGLMFSCDALRDELPLLVDALAESVMQPRLTPWLVREEMEGPFSAVVQQQREDRVQAAEEAVHAAAFGAQSALGHSQFATPASVSGVDDAVLREYLSRNFVGDNVVIVANNVPHKPFEELMDMYFLGVPSVSQSEIGKTQRAASYEGGVYVVRNDAAPSGSLSHLHLAFQGPAASSKDVHAARVLQQLIGSAPYHVHRGGFREQLAALRVGAGPLQEMGHGKAQSRASRAQEAAGDAIVSLQGAAHAYTDTGLVGVHALVRDDKAPAALEALSQLLKELAEKPVGDSELAAAKGAYKMDVATQQESQTGRRHALAAQALSSQGSVAGQQLSSTLQAIDGVSAEDVQRVAQEALKSDPSLGLVGAGANVPRYDRMAKMFR